MLIDTLGKISTIYNFLFEANTILAYRLSRKKVVEKDVKVVSYILDYLLIDLCIPSHSIVSCYKLSFKSIWILIFTFDTLNLQLRILERYAS